MARLTVSEPDPSAIRIDTHVAVWLYTGEVEKLSGTAVALLEAHPIVASPMVRLELGYLHEVGRLTVGGADVVNDLRSRVGLEESRITQSSAVDCAMPISWTRDPFDRMIVGDALAAGATLLTADAAILDNTESAVW